MTPSRVIRAWALLLITGGDTLLPCWMALGWADGGQGWQEVPSGHFSILDRWRRKPTESSLHGLYRQPTDTLPASVCPHRTGGFCSSAHAVLERCAASSVREGEVWEEGKVGDIQEKSGRELLLLCSSLVQPSARPPTWLTLPNCSWLQVHRLVTCWV